MRNILILLVFLCGSTPASALTLYFDAWSYHWDRSKRYNEKHNLIGIEYNGWMYLKYLNSHNKKSHAIGRHAIWGSKYGFTYGLKYGLVTGYSEVYRLTGNVMPFALLSVDGHGLVFGVGPGMVTGGFRWRFN